MTAFTPRLDRIVIGVDDSPASLYALDLAAVLGTPSGAALHIVHVRPQVAALGFSAAAAVQYERTEDQLDRLVNELAAGCLGHYAGTWTVAIRTGHVAHELLALADTVRADLVVVGHSGRGTVRDAILGSVATAAVHHSNRSVLVAIPPV
jgi:nucleotide-binding universal stress UspA family protein